MRKRFSEPEFQVKFHRWLKYLWLTIALFALIPTNLSHSFDNSITVVVFISIYANYISHWSTERALEAQLESRNEAPTVEGNKK